MNPEMQKQVSEMIVLLGSFTRVCKITAIKNDGIIDNEEKIILEKIDRATEKYIKELSKLK